MSIYTVTSNNTGNTVRVRCDSDEEAALRGAIKLGVRRDGRKPTMVNRYSRDSSLFHVYQWDKSQNASVNCYHSVYVSEPI